MLQLFYPYEYAESVYAIDYEKLCKTGIKGIIFDIDTTLVHHGDAAIPEIEKLFVEIQGLGLKTILLTDNDEQRTLKFLKNISSPYICDANKPFPRAYKKALDVLGAKKSEAVVVGDQIFKDILGANLSGIPSILVKFIRLEGETNFGKRRQAESFILNFYVRSRRYKGRLGKIIR